MDICERYFDIEKNSALEEESIQWRELAPAHWFMLQQLSYFSSPEMLAGLLEEHVASEEKRIDLLSMLTPDVDIRDSILHLYRIEPDLDLVRSIEAKEGVSVEGYMFGHEYANDLFLQNMDRQQYQQYRSKGTPVHVVNEDQWIENRTISAPVELVDARVSSSLLNIREYIGAWPDTRLARDCKEIQHLLKASRWVNVAARADVSYQEMVDYLSQQPLVAGAEAEELLEVLLEKREKECSDCKPVTIEGWNDFPWGLNSIPDAAEFPACVQKQKELLERLYTQVSTNELSAGEIEWMDDAQFTSLLQSGVSLSSDTLYKLSAAKLGLYIEKKEGVCSNDLKIRNFFSGRGQLPDVSRYEIVSELVRVGRVLEPLKQAVNRLLASGTLYAYAALDEVVKEGGISRVLPNVDFSNYTGAKDVHQSLRSSILNALNESLEYKMIFYGLCSIFFMSISFYLMLIDSIAAVFVLIVPTSMSLHQYSELVEQKEYNEFRLSVGCDTHSVKQTEPEPEPEPSGLRV